MKFKSFLSAGLMATVAALTFNVQAADSSQSTENKTKPHSHVEEKTGVPQKFPESKAGKEEKAAEPKPEKKRLDQDRTKHYHPRDGK